MKTINSNLESEQHIRLENSTNNHPVFGIPMNWVETDPNEFYILQFVFANCIRQHLL